MKRNQFRIQLFEGANKTAELVALEAAKYNGKKDSLSVALLYAFAMTVNTLGGDADTSIELVGENELTVDTKINGEWETVCLIQEIEILEMVKIVDEDDIKAEILSNSRFPRN